MKEITIFCPTIGVGGVEKNLYLISNYLIQKNLKVNLITCNFEKRKNFNKNIKIIGPKNTNYSKSSQFLKILICLYYFFKSNIIQRKTTLFSFQSNIYLILVAILIGHKIITRINSSPDIYLKNPIKKLFFSKIYKFSDCVIVNSHDLKNKVKRYLKINSKVIYNPAYSGKNFNLKYKKKRERQINLLNVGRLTYQKNQLLLLRALNEIENINYKLILIGNGSEEKKLNEFIKLNRLQKKIKMIKNVTNVNKYLSKCDTFILTSRYEGLPNVLIEAQMYKKFIISSDCPTGPKEILMNGKAGYLFKNGDINDLKIKLKKFFLKKDSIEIIQKINIGYENLNRFNKKKNLEKYFNEINKIK